MFRPLLSLLMMLAMFGLIANADLTPRILNAAMQRSGSVNTDYYLLHRGERATIPTLSTFSLSGQPTSSAQYQINLRFERGCADSSDFNGQTGFVALNCYYNKTAFRGCIRDGDTAADPFFVPGQEVYFASGVELSVNLINGVRASAAIPVASVVWANEWCGPLNAQEEVVDIMTFKWLTRDYWGIAPYLSPDVSFATSAFAYEYHGVVSVITYFMLGDVSISDVFETMNITRDALTSQGSLVTGGYVSTVRSVQLPEGQNIYVDTQQQRVRFNEYNLITKANLFVNTALVFSMFPEATSPNITHLCQIIQNSCAGPLQQFANFSDCVNFMSTRPLLKGPTPVSVGVDDVACRGYHANVAIANPQEHCIHTGPYDARLTMGAGGLLVTPCVDDYPVPGQDPLRSLPTGPVSRRVRSAETPLSACNDPICNYHITHNEDRSFLLGSLALDELMVRTIPAAGAVLQNCVNAGRC